jgi:hypothetical protein
LAMETHHDLPLLPTSHVSRAGHAKASHALCSRTTIIVVALVGRCVDAFGAGCVSIV